MRPQIYALINHPSDLLGAYGNNAPDGSWTGRLDDRAWGKSANLLCYFTDTGTGEQHRLSVFFDKEYRPAKGGPAMDEEPLGQVFRITTKPGRTGLPRFMTAELADPVASS